MAERSQGRAQGSSTGIGEERRGDPGSQPSPRPSWGCCWAVSLSPRQADPAWRADGRTAWRRGEGRAGRGSRGPRSCRRKGTEAESGVSDEG